MKYDVPIEVTKIQYDKIMIIFAGYVVGREREDKYYIKVWITRIIPNLIKIL